MSDEIESTIEQYRRAGLAGADLAEIEDHLRALTADLRASGLPAATAVTEAARRLGDPSTLAREHARVRSPFGPKLPRARAWSAALLLSVMFGFSIVARLDHDVPLLTPDMALSVVVLGALWARLTWARAVMLGAVTFSIASMACHWIMLEPWHSDSPWPWVVLSAGALAFLIPWRRGELTAPAIALALVVWAYHGIIASASMLVNVWVEDSAILFGWSALALIVISSCGIVLRARWAAITAMVAAASLASTLIAVLMTGYAPSSDLHELLQVIWLGEIVIGVVAASVAAVIAWRTARSRLGRFDAVLT